ncbi:hypothetical protein K5M36_16875 [Chromobacterium vaccinii]|nr:hypothetical protein [Chromobacterium vaccinii]
MTSMLDFLVEAGLAAWPLCRPLRHDSMMKIEEALKAITSTALGTTWGVFLASLNCDSKNQRLYIISSVTSRTDSVHSW